MGRASHLVQSDPGHRAVNVRQTTPTQPANPQESLKGPAVSFVHAGHDKPTDSFWN